MAFKRKKSHIGLWIFLFIVFVVIVLPVGLVYAFLYDSTTETVEYDEGTFNMETMANDLIVDAMDNTKETGKLEIGLTTKKLNSFIRNMFDENFADIKDYVPKAYILTEEDSDVYDFYVEAQAIPTFTFFKTRVNLSTTLSFEDDTFTFAINNVKIGRLGNLQKIALNLAGDYINDQDITNAIQNSGFHMEVDFKNLKITYTKDAFLDDITSMMGSEEGGEADNGGDFMTSLLTEFMSSNIFSATFKGDGIAASIDLSTFHVNDNYTTISATEDTLKIREKCDILGKMVDQDLITTNQFEDAFDYLLHGYESLEDGSASKNLIDSMNHDKLQSLLNIVDYSTYKGESEKFDNDSSDLVTKVQAGLPSASNPTALMSALSTGHLTDLYESDINDYIFGMGVTGYTMFFSKDTNEGCKVNYISVDNFYTNIVNNTADPDSIIFNLGLSVNGYELSLVFVANLESDPTQPLVLKFCIDENKIFLGNKVASKTITDMFFGLMEDGFAGSDGGLGFDLETMSLEIDLSDSFSPELMTAIQGFGYNAEINIIGTDVNDDNARLSIDVVHI